MPGPGPSIVSPANQRGARRRAERGRRGRVRGAGDGVAWLESRNRSGCPKLRGGQDEMTRPSRSASSRKASASRVCARLIPPEFGAHRRCDALGACGRPRSASARRAARDACAAAARRRPSGPARAGPRRPPRRAGRARRRRCGWASAPLLGGDSEHLVRGVAVAISDPLDATPRRLPRRAADRRARPPCRAGSRASGTARRARRARRSGRRSSSPSAARWSACRP